MVGQVKVIQMTGFKASSAVGSEICNMVLGVCFRLVQARDDIKMVSKLAIGGLNLFFHVALDIG